MLKDPGARTHSEEELKEFLKPIPGKTPDEAAKSMETVGGFRMELVAHEPLVVDPVAAEFDENGQLYVCEMRDYPYRPKEGEKPLGTIRLLRDTNGDGVFDDAHVFADGLLWASGVVPWKGGVYVASAPDIWYLKDTDGDHRADVRIKIFTGFGTQNQQAMLSNLKFGLDHKIYGSTGPNGGKVRAADAEQSEGVSVSGRDFRFDPNTHEFETITGTIQFGNSFDDWGNRFLCSQSQPLLQEVLPQKYLARNPYLPVPSAINDLAGASVPIFRTSPTERWRQIRSDRWITQLGRDPTQADVSQYVVDAAAGVTVYRGAAYPKEYYNNVFVGDAQNNIIHRRTLIPDGATFKSQRADEGTEFVRSADNWFRPVNFINAPDGTLYVLDMSREIIESNNIPLDVATHLDLKNGRDKGRIYRLAPPGFRPAQAPRLGDASTAELVATLEHPSSWWRDTAHRLIHERQDRTCVPALRALLADSLVPQARVLALWSLLGLHEMAEDDLELSLADKSPEIREHAIRLSEPRLDASPKLLERVLAQGYDPHARICLQVAFSLGETKDPRTISVLAEIARKNVSDRWIRTAVLSSVANTADRVFIELLRDTKFAESGERIELLTELAQIVGARGHSDEVSRVIVALAEHAGSAPSERIQSAVILGLGKGMKQRGGALPEPESLAHSGARFLGALISRAQSTALNRDMSIADRLQAIKLLGCLEYVKSQSALRDLLNPHEPPDVQLATLDALAEYTDATIASLVIRGWAEYLPAVRMRAIRLLLSREGWTEEYLDVVNSGRSSVAEIEPTGRTQLLQHRKESIRLAAERLFGNSPRQAVIAEYRASLRQPGDPSRGQVVFKRECAACHRVGGDGFEVGPDLASSPSRDPEALLINVLDPNHFVDPANLQYQVIDNAGRTFTGKIEAETATSVTLTRGQGIRDTILRTNIDEIVNSGKSLMPEGFEKTITKEEMANLIAFLNGLEPARGSKRASLIGGTRPGTVEP
jgi:putative membrane-bound dehydrogenase-like protein